MGGQSRHEVMLPSSILQVRLVVPIYSEIMILFEVALIFCKMLKFMCCDIDLQ